MGLPAAVVTTVTVGASLAGKFRPTSQRMDDTARELRPYSEWRAQGHRAPRPARHWPRQQAQWERHGGTRNGSEKVSLVESARSLADPLQTAGSEDGMAHCGAGRAQR